MPPNRNKIPRKEKEEPIAGGAMADCVLPEDLMLCILTRLPVKSILRFKSVCKPWRELIHTPEFVKMHQGEFTSDPKKHSVIFYQARTCGLYVSTIIESTGKKKPTVTKTILDRPYPETDSMDILGCCNGLICLVDRGGFERRFVLWNPALKLYKCIRVPKMDFRESLAVSLGFGYDADRDDFKVAKIVCVLNKGIPMDITGVEVYSAESDSWTTIELGFQFSVLRVRNRRRLIVNGNPYWVATVKDEEVEVEVLLCLDVRNMVFKIVPLQAFHLHRFCIELVDWKGNIGALLCEKDESGMCTSLGVWVLDDGEGIWRKIHTLGPIQGSVDRFTMCLKNGKLVGKRPNGILIVFDPENGVVEEIVIEEGQNRPFKIYGYTESLTYVKGMIKEPEEREWDSKRKHIEDMSTYQYCTGL